MPPNVQKTAAYKEELEQTYVGQTTTETVKKQLQCIYPLTQPYFTVVDHLCTQNLGGDAPAITCISLSFLCRHRPEVPEITLVPHQHDDNVGVGMVS